MIKSNLKIIFNNFLRQKFYTVLNLLGLAVGLGCVLVIALFLQHQLSYDRHYANADRIYLVGMDFGNERVGPAPSFLTLRSLLTESFPEELTIISRYENFNRIFFLTREDISLSDFLVHAVDPEFLRIFDFEWIAGDENTALNRPESIVITRSLAEKYFGAEEALGNTMMLNGALEVVVTGVIEDLPETTTLSLTALVPMSLMYQQSRAMGIEPSDQNLFYSTYVLLEEEADPEQLRAQFPDFLMTHYNEEFANAIKLTLTNITDVYPGGVAFLNGVPAGSRNAITNATLIKIFFGVALGILVISVVNYMNLATARASVRAKEVGLKQSLGVGKFELVRQFLSESVFMVAVAMVFATALCELALPVFNDYFRINLNFVTLDPVTFLSAILLAILTIGLAAGSYPAFYLTAHDPAKVLRGDLTKGRTGKLFRDFLVVVQFSISILLIVIIAVMVAQMAFGRSFDRGFVHENIVIQNFPDENVFNVMAQWTSLQNTLLAIPGVSDVTYGPDPKSDRSSGAVLYKEGSDEFYQTWTMPVAGNYLELYDIRLISGRTFDENEDRDIVSGFPAESPGFVSGGVLLSEKVARENGWTPEEAVGKNIRLSNNNIQVNTVVIGVVENTISDTKNEPTPLIYMISDVIQPRSFSLRLAEDYPAETPAQLQGVFESFFQEDPGRITFLQERIDFEFFQEERQISILTGAALIAVLLSCIGLIGLASFNAECRTKEIGVRKVMGGSVWSIVLLLTNDFSKLVLIANVIAWPVAYIAMSRWLENFVYRIDLSPLIFIGSGLIALCIAWVTVGGTAAKAASAKPALALRYE